MKLKNLTLTNFKGFKYFECDFQPKLNILVGLNGQGKTSVLDAISVAYGQFLTALGAGVDRGVANNEIHLAKHVSDHDSFSISMEHQFPVQIECEVYDSEFYDFPKSWHRSRNTFKGRTTQVKELKDIARTLQTLVQNNEAIDLPMLGYYGTGRLWKQKKLSSLKVESLIKSSRLEGYRDCLDPESSYSAFAKWLRTETIAEFERKMQIIESSGLSDALVSGSTARGRLLSAIACAVNKVLQPSGWSNLRFSARAKEIIATHPEQGDVPVSMLSDGVRNMIGMVADIAYRCVRLNPHMEEDAVIKTHGIVLIDEVDMHLHPEWQQLVLQNLEEAFPSIQFIVTTHSPQVLSTVKKEQILILKGEHAEPPIGNTFGEPSSYILNQVLSVDSRPPLPHSKILKHYLMMVESGQGKSSEAKKLRETLEELMGTHHSDLQMADRSIQRKELLG
jgi:predicted ATP-binding protein involved in virulence